MKKLLFWALILFVLSSCQDAYLKEIDSPIPEGELVEVSLNVGVSLEENGSMEVPYGGATRAIDDPDNFAQTEIKNLWVVQFNGTSESSTLLGTAKYIEDYGDVNQRTIELVATGDQECLIFFIANTFDRGIPFPVGLTVSAFKAKSKDISSEANLFSKGASLGGTSFPDDATYHMLLNGYKQQTVSATAGQTISTSLKRNISRIDFTLTNNVDGMIVKSVQLQSVPAFSRYSNYDYASSSLGASTVYPSSPFFLIDYPSQVCSLSNGVTETFKYYVPTNMRGQIVNTIASEKNNYAPGGSTRVLIEAQHDNKDYTYTFFLGANLVNDFNIKPNHKYTYTITLNSTGDPSSDSRVESWGDVDFTTGIARANCYILNPHPSKERSFTIPVDRVDEFWGNQGYENEATNVLGATTAWSVEVLWSDFDFSDGSFAITTSQGSGSSGSFTVKTTGNVAGNVVVKLYKTVDVDKIALWSWHLWITDYNPDMKTIPDGRYRYPVSGGALHRYAGTHWDSGIYSNKFIMDRNLGSLDATSYVGYGKGSLYYQFGRKDPFYGNITTYPSTTISAVSGGENKMPESVKNPLTYLTGSFWTNNDKYNPSTFSNSILWQDPLTATGKSKQGEKSLFDPCPHGWRVPQTGVWSGFTSNTTTTPTTNINGGATPQRGFTPFSTLGMNGLRYWPYLGQAYEVTDEVYYPASGLRGYSNGGLVNAGSNGYYWSASPGSSTNGYYLYFYSTGLYPQNNSNRAYGFPVRCVQE